MYQNTPDDVDAITAAILAPTRDASHPDHVHVCAWSMAEGESRCAGRCACSCGAMLAMGPTYGVDGRWVWQHRDGTTSPFPDPRLKDDSATL